MRTVYSQYADYSSDVNKTICQTKPPTNIHLVRKLGRLIYRVV